MGVARGIKFERDVDMGLSPKSEFDLEWARVLEDLIDWLGYDTSTSSANHVNTERYVEDLKKEGAAIFKRATY